MTPFRARGAFTLIEILVVLVIIGILAALLFPVFARVRENGRRTVCLSNMRQIVTAVALYTQDSAGQYPIFDYGVCAGSSADCTPPRTWAQSVSSYASNPTVFQCPSDTEWDLPMKQRGVMCATCASWVPTSYIANRDCLSEITIKGTAFVRWVRPAFERDVARPASTILLSDGALQADGQPPYTQPVPNTLHGSDTMHMHTLQDPSCAAFSGGCCGGSLGCNQMFAPNDRHLGRANVAFADGHVKAMLNSDWYFPKTPFLDPKRGG